MTTTTGLSWINTVIANFVGAITELFTNTNFILTMIFVLILFFVVRTVLGVISGKY